MLLYSIVIYFVSEVSPGIEEMKNDKYHQHIFFFTLELVMALHWTRYSHSFFAPWSRKKVFIFTLLFIVLGHILVRISKDNKNSQDNTSILGLSLNNEGDESSGGVSSLVVGFIALGSVALISTVLFLIFGSAKAKRKTSIVTFFPYSHPSATETEDSMLRKLEKDVTKIHFNLGVFARLLATVDEKLESGRGVRLVSETNLNGEGRPLAPSFTPDEEERLTEMMDELKAKLRGEDGDGGFLHKALYVPETLLGDLKGLKSKDKTLLVKLSLQDPVDFIRKYVEKKHGKGADFKAVSYLRHKKTEESGTVDMTMPFKKTFGLHVTPLFEGMPFARKPVNELDKRNHAFLLKHAQSRGLVQSEEVDLTNGKRGVLYWGNEDRNPVTTKMTPKELEEANESSFKNFWAKAQPIIFDHLKYVEDVRERWVVETIEREMQDLEAEGRLGKVDFLLEFGSGHFMSRHNPGLTKFQFQVHPETFEPGKSAHD